MKKILSTALAIGMTTTVVTAAYAADKGNKTIEKDHNISEQAKAEGEYFAGLIEGYEGGKVKVKALFSLDNRVDRNKPIYIDVTGSKFEKFPEGYIIGVYYDDIKTTEKGMEITPNIISSVEENKQVSIMPSYYDNQGDEVTIMPIDEQKPGNGDEVSIMPIDMTEGKELFIGVIQGKEGDLVKVRPIFEGGKEFKEGKDVYLNIKGSEFLNEKVEKYPKGYLMSIYYTDMKELDNKYEIKADLISAVEEDQVITIDDGEMLNEDKAITIDDGEKLNGGEATIQIQEAAEKEAAKTGGVFQIIVDFFKNLF